MKKRIFAAVVAVCLLLSGCVWTPQSRERQYTATYFDLFDTVTSVIGRAESEADFQDMARQVYEQLREYHRLFDIYNEYEGLCNLKTVNDRAGIAPVQVDGEIIRLLQDCKQYYALTDGRVNVAMGSVLQLWHEARRAGTLDPENAWLPDMDVLQEAAQHTDIDSIIIDAEASTVYIEDPRVRLDVGAIAKGWAVQRAAEKAPSGLLISVGGNVCATGPKKADGTPWVIGIQDPDNADSNLHTLQISGGSVVTSGDYQRAYVVDGKEYHHIIDPDTLMPASRWSSVSILCQDSGLADALSTALFLMEQEAGAALAEKCGAEAFWVGTNGEAYMTPGFAEHLRS